MYLISMATSFNGIAKFRTPQPLSNSILESLINESCPSDGLCNTSITGVTNTKVVEVETARERTCDTLIMCIITTLNKGLRSGGGIGDVLRKSSSQVSINYDMQLKQERVVVLKSILPLEARLSLTLPRFRHSILELYPINHHSFQELPIKNSFLLRILQLVYCQIRNQQTRPYISI